ncbi:FAD-dependent oxidoreductase [Flavivirga sp. 57AJ16]|uniref:FAD-dependent oxidoreductase n=1 Tax=Flavivirga sp. 57AJ16 TaxID=3025307 RepID=UPI0023663509|nr:FAD-dependent oxidoreductase [Flavivirga sp. 57AJ16]MDD7887549.1 FAD-dependent oxidoreductase [Flavivirga sp. 57AJ16]
MNKLFAYEYDVVIVGGTPAGITAAIAAAREGKDCLILERTPYIGGLPVNGLGATDIATRDATTGLFKQFVSLNKEYYKAQFGIDSPQAKQSSDGYHFEPHVAAASFDKMIGMAGPGKIEVLVLRQFDSAPKYVNKEGNTIQSIRILNRQTGQEEYYSAKVFIDATYEGDLGAAAGVPYRLGREGIDEFKEPCAGKIYRWWKLGPDEEGTTYQGDNAIQAYNYRLCLTNNPNNRLPVVKPEAYDREEFVSLIEDVLSGRNTDIRFSQVDSAQIQANRRKILAGEKTAIPGDPWGIWKLCSMTSLPNRKVDANNQHLALISTDLPEENWPWPTSGWAWRDQYAKRLKSYTLGLLWFAQNDKALPEHFREACKSWGFAKDEYQDNHGFPRQVYVREGRRLEGVHLFTAHDALPVNEGGRPPIYKTSVTASHYALDSHAVRKRELGRVHLDGFFSHFSAPYTVPYEVMVPKFINNLLFPVAVSGSHVGFSTLRMEPCWMALGEAAGIAAALIVDNGVTVREISISTLQNTLLNNDATLIYFKDLKTTDAEFKEVQKLALRGFFTEWEASLDEDLDENTSRLWNNLINKSIPYKGKTKREIIEKFIKQ